MAARIKDQLEISLNGVIYAIKGAVQSILTSLYPAKVVIGDTSRDSRAGGASVISWSDFRGGNGLEIMKGAAEVDRAWWSYASLRYEEHLILPPLVTTASVLTDSGSWLPEWVMELNLDVYCVFTKGLDNRVYKYTGLDAAAGQDGWANVLTLPNAVTVFDSIEIRLNGTIYLVFTYQSGTTFNLYTTTTDGATFNNETNGVKYMCAWDDRLWGIDNEGILKWTDDLSPSTPTWTSDAQIPMAAIFVKDLFVGPDSNGNPIIYASTGLGLYAHDAGNQAWVATKLAFTYHHSAGTGSVVWRDDIYISAGMGIYKYSPGSTSVITVIGPDRDHGIPTAAQGTIEILIPTLNDLIAVVSPTSTQSTGETTILAWNGIGWETRYHNAESGTSKSFPSTMASAAYDYASRLWFIEIVGGVPRVRHFILPKDVINPKKIAATTYAAAGELHTPWFNAGQVDVTKLALEARIDTVDCTANEAVTVYYGLDYSDSWTQFTDTHTSDSTFDATDDRVEGNGVTTFKLGSLATPSGTKFRAIRFKLALVRGGTTTLSPDVKSLTLVYRKKLPAKWGHTLTIDLTKRKGNRSAKAQRATLMAAIEKEDLVEFTFRDDTGETRNYYVDIVSATGLENTGHDETGEARVSLVEP